jgi:hypothetical protein
MHWRGAFFGCYNRPIFYLAARAGCSQMNRKSKFREGTRMQLASLFVIALTTTVTFIAGFLAGYSYRDHHHSRHR